MAKPFDVDLLIATVDDMVDGEAREPASQSSRLGGRTPVIAPAA